MLTQQSLTILKCGYKCLFFSPTYSLARSPLSLSNLIMGAGVSSGGFGSDSGGGGRTTKLDH